MALPLWVQGARRPSLLITWLEKDTTTPEPLTGATLTGLLRRSGSDTAQAIVGTLTLTDAANGVFRWDFAAADVAVAGDYTVEFVASFGSGQSPAKTFAASWTVTASLSGG